MLNQCNFIGRIGRDPESKYTPSGKQVVNFSIAVSEKRGGEEKTEWINVVCWEKTAKFVADYMHKGNLCFVSGRFATRKWQDQAGADRYTTEIIASTVQNLSPRDESRNNSTPPMPPDGFGHPSSTGNEVPF